MIHPVEAICLGTDDLPGAEQRRTQEPLREWIQTLAGSLSFPKLRAEESMTRAASGQESVEPLREWIPREHARPRP